MATVLDSLAHPSSSATFSGRRTSLPAPHSTGLKIRHSFTYHSLTSARSNSTFPHRSAGIVCKAQETASLVYGAKGTRGFSRTLTCLLIVFLTALFIWQFLKTPYFKDYSFSSLDIKFHTIMKLFLDPRKDSSLLAARILVPAASEATWKSLVIESELPVLVEFWAPWCGPCRMIHPVVDDLSKDYVRRRKQ